MRIIEPHTTINELFNKNIISAHLCNCLRRAGFVDMEALCEHYGQSGILSFLRYKNFGQKALSELERLLQNVRLETPSMEEMDNRENVEVIGELCADEFERQTKDDAVFRTVYPEVSMLCWELVSLGEMPDYGNWSFEPGEVVEIWSRLRKLMAVFLELPELSDYPGFCAKLRRLCRIFDSQFEKSKFFLYLNACLRNPEMGELLEMKYARLKQEASLHVRRLLGAHYGTYWEALERYFMLPMGDQNYYRCGKRAMEELKRIFTAMYDYAYTLALGHPDEKNLLLLHHDFDFLRYDEVDFADTFRKRNGHLPMLFILYKYLLRSTGRFEVYYRKQIGLGCKAVTIRQISYEEGLSFERVRQILTEKQFERFQIRPSDWKAYAGLLGKDFLASFDEDCANVMSSERLADVSFEIFGNLCALVGDFKRIGDGAHSCFIRRKYVDAFKFRVSLKRLSSVRMKRSIRDFSLPLGFFMDDCWREELSAGERREIEKIYVELASQMYGVVRKADGTLYFGRNALNVEEALYDIIKSNGAPMHISGIFFEFKRRHPNHYFSEPYQIRSQLLLSKRIRAIGKSSKFAIDAWQSVYTGTIGGLLYKILKENENPMTLDELYDAVKDTFPKTNTNSINSMLMGDDARRYIKYHGGYIGLKEKNYDPKFSERTRPADLRRPFAQRLSELEDFLSAHDRSPVQNASDKSEVSLHRWMKNMESGRLLVTDEQRAAFEDLLARNSHRMISGAELSFRKKCDSVKKCVLDNRRLPSATENPPLYRWLVRQSVTHADFADRRKGYFKELVEFLRLYGLEVPTA